MIQLGMPKALPIELRERVVRAFVDQGMNVLEIVDLFGVSQSSVKRWVAKYENGESLEPGRAPGAERKLDETDEAWLRGELTSNPYATTYELTAKFNREFSSNSVHRSTILRTLKRLGFTVKKRPRTLHNENARMSKKHGRSSRTSGGR